MEEDQDLSRPEDGGEGGFANDEEDKLDPRSEMLRDMVGAKEKRLMDAMAARKQVVKDAELLKNRIALLQMEERKARKKIEETKKRTSEVVMLK